MMRGIQRHVVLVLFGLLFALAGPGHADTLTTPSGSTIAADSGPRRGLSMERVRASYGVPNQEVAAVGTPPITRWVYGGFTVYFEHEFVIHAVQHP